MVAGLVGSPIRPNSERSGCLRMLLTLGRSLADSLFVFVGRSVMGRTYIYGVLIYNFLSGY